MKSGRGGMASAAVVQGVLARFTLAAATGRAGRVTSTSAKVAAATGFSVFINLLLERVTYLPATALGVRDGASLFGNQMELTNGRTGEGGTAGSDGGSVGASVNANNLRLTCPRPSASPVEAALFIGVSTAS